MSQSLTLLPGRYAVARGPSDAPIPTLPTGNFTSITRTADELSIVCQDENIPTDASVERGLGLLKVDGP